MKNKSFILIGGFDGTGGAGILADFKIARHLNLNPYVVITNIAVQNNTKGFGNFPVSKEVLRLSLQSIFDEAEIEFVKIGMVGSLELAKELTEILSAKNIKIILDTPLKATNGAILQNKDIVLELSKKSFLITPNLEEFEELDLKISNSYILIKSFKSGTDRLMKGENTIRDFSLPSIDLKKNVRGTGCSLSSAICSFLFLGYNLEEAIEKAKNLIYNGIKNSDSGEVVDFLGL
jgi:hydroxymethylpyrimidine/phosphomethylpyrimidine kinase